MLVDLIGETAKVLLPVVKILHFYHENIRVWIILESNCSFLSLFFHASKKEDPNIVLNVNNGNLVKTVDKIKRNFGRGER